MEKFGHYASDNFMKRFANTFRDVVFVNGTRSMANRVDGSGTSGFEMYNECGHQLTGVWGLVTGHPGTRHSR